MNPIMSAISAIVGPITGILQKREEKKLAKITGKLKIEQAVKEGNLNVELNDQELERVHAAMKAESWLDEFVTVSLYLVFYGIGAGSVAAAFGHPEVLEGVALAVRTLVEMGVDVGFLLEAVTLAAVGLVVWRRL